MATETLRPTSAGIYSIFDASLFIAATMPQFPEQVKRTYPFRVTTRHLHRWVKEGLVGKYLEGLHGDDIALTFLDLISMRMVAIFRSCGVKPKDIREAHSSLSSERGWPHPFAMEPLWTFGGDIFVNDYGRYHAVTRNWQLAFDFVKEYLLPEHGLIFDEHEEAESWEPEDGIQLDPKIAFGAPCLKGTRITTETLWSFHLAGDTQDRIALAYRIPIEHVEAAFVWEQRLDQIAA